MSRLDKSQLRRLALDFADGEVAADDYRARRRALVDGIVDGSVAIEREPPANTLPRDLFSSTVVEPGAAKPVRRWPAILGVAGALCVAIVVMLVLWPVDDPPPPAPLSPVTPTVGLSPARALVESFVARRDFAADALHGFETQWAALAPSERDEARGSLWFGSLVRALRDEMKTQNALAGLDGGEAALARAGRIAALGETLGISGQLPQVGMTRPPALDASAPAAGQQGDTARPATQPAAADALPPASAGVTARATAASPAHRTLTGREWLERQGDAQLTLQLFAVNALDRVEQLMAAHPELAVRVLATDGTAPRFRVFHGVFSDEAAARNAFDALPADITRASQGAIVKSFAAVRDDLAGRTAVATPAASLSPASASESYTLQLFATGNLASARSLVDSYPDLPLQLRQLDGDAAPFRVVYGRFESMDSAREAQSKLPAALLSRIGTPLAKPLADTGSRVSP